MVTLILLVQEPPGRPVAAAGDAGYAAAADTANAAADDAALY